MSTGAHAITLSNSSPFWCSSIAILNYESDVFAFIRSGIVSVHLSDVERLSANTVHLATGNSLEADGVIFATGWEHVPKIKFLPEGIEHDLGLPYSLAESDAPTLVTEADQEVFSRFPTLANQPVINSKLKIRTTAEKYSHPYRLYRFTCPPSDQFDRSIVFIGILHSASHCVLSQIQSLWAIAYMAGDLKLESEVDRAREAMLASRWLFWRYPVGYSGRVPDYALDSMPHFDLLLRDLGLNSRRKSGFLAEWFTPYNPPDYKDIVQEWRTKP